MSLTDLSLHQDRLRRFLALMEPGSVGIFPSAFEARRSNDSEFEFRADSDFFYLTGFPEPDALALLTKDHPDTKLTLFVRPKDVERELWTGRRQGPEGAIANFGAQQAFNIDEFDMKATDLLANATNLYFTLGRYPKWDRRLIRILNALRSRQKKKVYPPRIIRDPAATLHQLRLVKTEAEIDNARRAGAVSAEGHMVAMARCKPGMHEYELQAAVEYVFRSRGCAPGYTTIVGAGANATVLHYVSNNCKIKDGELVLIDAGAELPSLFTGDITRTFPVNGKFSRDQSALYEIVLDAQQKAIAAIKPGATVDAVHKTAQRALAEGLISLGLLQGQVHELIETENGAFKKRYYPHGTSHWLGMDVHDVGDYYQHGTPTPLAPGMILTVEPGLYIPADDKDAPEKFRGIGIRIEDDVLVTARGADILTAACPKTISDVEKAMKTPTVVFP